MVKSCELPAYQQLTGIPGLDIEVEKEEIDSKRC